MSLKTVCQNTTNTCSTLDNILVEFKYYFQWHVKHNNTVCVISLIQSQLLFRFPSSFITKKVWRIKFDFNRI